MQERSKAATDSTDPFVGQLLGGKYSIDRLIGRGGMGLVYLAHQRLPKREVVVKVLAPHWIKDAEAVARFEREAERLGSVRHPNIVEMYDHGHENGRAYLIMEYLRGHDLASLVSKNRRLSLEQFVPIAAQILKGIGHAHSRELMVRDIKPANIMLCDRKGRANFVKILDFGLAKLLKNEQPVTQEHILGTVGYLAPEAIKGQELDLRVDVYALGVLFYYMLAGRLPFAGDESASLFYKTVNEAPDLLNEVLPADHQVPPGLIHLIHRSLEKDRRVRPADANELVEELIDVVPASLFRLPRTSQHTVAVPGVRHLSSPGAGNTGMVELVGDHAISDVHLPLKPSPAHRLQAITSPLPTSETLPPSDTGPLTAAPAKRGAATIALVAATVIAVVGGAAAAATTMGGSQDDEGTVAAAVGQSPSDSYGPQAALTQAEALLARGEYELAAAKLDVVRTHGTDTPTLKARLERADKRVEQARLLAAATQLENDDNRVAAIAAYRDLLVSDPSNIPAREALARLEPGATAVPPNGEPPDPDLELGSVVITSRPMANLFVDGTPMGTTPFKGKLPTGTRHLRLTARGHGTWERDIKVLTEGTAPIKVRMSSRGWTKRRSGSSSVAAATTDVAAPTPAPAPPAPPVEKPAKKEVTPLKKAAAEPKSSVFLPTPKKSGDNQGGVFLPTKE